MIFMALYAGVYHGMVSICSNFGVSVMRVPGCMSCFLTPRQPCWAYVYKQLWKHALVTITIFSLFDLNATLWRDVSWDSEYFL